MGDLCGVERSKRNRTKPIFRLKNVFGDLGLSETTKEGTKRTDELLKKFRETEKNLKRLKILEFSSLKKLKTKYT